MKTWQVERMDTNLSPVILSAVYALIGVILIGYTMVLIFSTRELMVPYMMVVAAIGGAVLLQGASTLHNVLKPKEVVQATFTFKEGVFIYKDTESRRIVFTTADIKNYKVTKGKTTTRVLFTLTPDAKNLKTAESIKELVFKISSDSQEDLENFLKIV